MLKHQQVVVTPFSQNCSVVYCDQTKKAALVDPGGDIEKIKAAIVELGVSVEKIWLTHGHLDHVGGTHELATELGINIEGPALEDDAWISQLDQQAAMFGLPQVPGFTPNRWLVEGDQLEIGNESLGVFFTPGHTPGHVVFYSSSSDVVFVGDVLFKNGIGRTDFPMGNHGQLINSIEQKLLTLPDETVVVSGHGPNTTIGQERNSNPYISVGVY